MKAKDVRIGKVYAAKVSGKVVPVKITAVHSGGGWAGINMTTNRGIRIRSPQRLRREWAERYTDELATPDNAAVAARLTELIGHPPVSAYDLMPSDDDDETFPPNAGTIKPGPRVRIPATRMPR